MYESIPNRPCPASSQTPGISLFGHIVVNVHGILVVLSFNGSQILQKKQSG